MYQFHYCTPKVSNQNLTYVDKKFEKYLSFLCIFFKTTTGSFFNTLRYLNKHIFHIHNKNHFYTTLHWVLWVVLWWEVEKNPNVDVASCPRDSSRLLPGPFKELINDHFFRACPHNLHNTSLVL